MANFVFTLDDSPSLRRLNRAACFPSFGRALFWRCRTAHWPSPAQWLAVRTGLNPVFRPYEGVRSGIQRGHTSLLTGMRYTDGNLWP